MKVTLDPETNGLVDHVRNIFVKARSNQRIVPVALPVLLLPVISHAPQLIETVLLNHPVQIILNRTCIVPVVQPVATTSQVIVLVVGL